MEIFKRIFNPFRTLTGKLIILLLSVLLLAFFTSSYIAYRLHLNISNKEISEQFFQRVGQMAERIDLRLQTMYRMSDQLVFDKQVVRSLANLNAGFPLTVEEQSDLNWALNQFFFSVTDLAALYIYDLEGRHIMPSSSMLPDQLGSNIRARMLELLDGSDGELVWERGTLQYDEIVHGEIFSDSPIILAARYMKDNRARIYGVLVLVIHESIFSNDLHKAIGGTQGRVYLMDKKGNLLYTDEPLKEKINLSLLRSVRDVSSLEEDGLPYLYTRAEIRKSTFHLISSISTNELYRKSRIILRVALISAISSISIAGLLIFLIIHRLLLPLKALVRGMQLVQTGNLNTRIHIGTRDELAFIGSRFNSMIDHIDSLIKEVYEKQLREREAELSMLQAQLNPHFLYNTLDMIHSKLYLQDDRETASLVINLASMLRYILEPPTDATVRSELEQARNYLSLQQARFPNHLQVSLEVEDDVLDCRILRFLLQPLIENCFVHGFRDHVKMMRVNICAYREQRFLIIEISDNGIGFSGDLHELKNGQQSDRRRIGLRNVIRRIELVYGKPYTLELHSRKGEGARFRLRLPYDIQEQGRKEEDR